jgi:uncharacterized protein YbaR (Trm112 family)
MSGSGSPACCPGCSAVTQQLQLEGRYGRTVEIDLCRACHALWLDGHEALQLSPGAVLTLVKTLDDPRCDRRPPQAILRCPRCRARLKATEDRQRDTRFHYFRCPRDHGRFITFFQFLRARNFVRELTAQELADLRRHLQSVNCSNCGAAVDVARASVCPYCRTPISTIEPGQVRKAIEELQQAETRRHETDPTLPLRLLEERQAVERAFAPAPGEAGGPLARMLAEHPGGGLVEAAIAALLRQLK